jgi:hypothetical protein
MKIYDIDTLLKDETGNYDLTQPTFKSDFTTLAYRTYEVQQGEEMRIDLICESIYNNTDYVDILLNVNSIDNPLNVRVGTILLYPVDNLELLRLSDIKNQNSGQILANTNKQQRKDTNRKQYVENKLNLPPTILNERNQQYDISSDIIILGDGLF